MPPKNCMGKIREQCERAARRLFGQSLFYPTAHHDALLDGVGLSRTLSKRADFARLESQKLRFYSWWLLGIITFAFIFEALYPGIIQTLSFRPQFFTEAPWTIITAMFMHANASHLLQNLFALGLFGIILEKIIGSRNFILLYFAGGIAGNIASYYFYPESLSLGASGAIMTVIGTLAVIRPKLIVYLGGPLPMILLAFMWVTIDLVGIFSADNIGHAAHLAGFALGALYGLSAREKYSEVKEAKKKVDVEISDDYLDEWEKEYMG